MRRWFDSEQLKKYELFDNMLSEKIAPFKKLGVKVHIGDILTTLSNRLKGRNPLIDTGDDLVNVLSYTVTWTSRLAQNQEILKQLGLTRWDRSWRGGGNSFSKKGNGVFVNDDMINLDGV